MLDTIRIETNRLFNLDIPDSLPDNWSSTDKFSEGVNDDGRHWESRKFTLTERDTGVRVSGTRLSALRIEASLPRLLFGHNGRLIHTQDQLDEALDKLNDLASEVCFPADDQVQDHVSRADLVWQLRGNIAEFLAAHKNCRHKSIRKLMGHYQGQGFYFQGQQLRVRFYDKRLKQHGQPGGVVRVEVQLFGNRLREAFSGFEWRKLTSLSFWRCYEVYREIMCGFCPNPLPRVSTMAEILALADREGWTSSGIPLFDIVTAQQSKRNVSRLRKQMALLRPAIHEINWETLLPKDELPPLVELSEPEVQSSKRSTP